MADSKEEWYNAINKKQKKSLLRSIKQADKGELISHKKVKKSIAKLITK
ncbi:MAG TPA: hypothetical protein VHZ50_18700 [Puia sp.]|jgi:hypothetical protein|nr:hypothetical protein [Puia sp.]